jgi:hypothetical protein
MVLCFLAGVAYCAYRRTQLREKFGIAGAPCGPHVFHLTPILMTDCSDQDLTLIGSSLEGRPCPGRPAGARSQSQCIGMSLSRKCSVTAPCCLADVCIPVSLILCVSTDRGSQLRVYISRCSSAGTRFGDFCTWLWCGPCALCQVGHLLPCSQHDVPSHPVSFVPPQAPPARTGLITGEALRQDIVIGAWSSALESGSKRWLA